MIFLCLMLIMYLYFYITTLLSLHYLLKNTFSKKLSKTSLPHMLYYINNISRYKYLFYGLFLALTGIPPFLLFLIKFNILVDGYYRLDFITAYIVFLGFFLHMLFYIQPESIKNIEFDFDQVTPRKKHISYKIIFFINFNLSLFYLSIFFFPDFILLANLVL